MSPLAYRTKFTLAMVLLPPFIVSLWMLGVPGAVSWSTYGAFAALLLALGAVTLMTWRNGKATGSMGQLLHATETEQAQHSRRDD